MFGFLYIKFFLPSIILIVMLHLRCWGDTNGYVLAHINK